jgi:siderophore synthetase component
VIVTVAHPSPLYTADSPDPQRTREALVQHRPDLVAAFDRELPAARAAVLRRLWTAIRREPLPGIVATRPIGGDVLVTLADGRLAIGPDLDPFARVGGDLRIRLQDAPGSGGEPYADPAELMRALRLPVSTDGLVVELANSVANLALARTGDQPVDLAGWQGDPHGLAVAEQAVLDGHPLHPCCRTRIGMSTLDVLAFAPEHGRTVDLQVWAVPRGRWLTTGAGLPPRLVLHPWQAAHFEQLLRDTGATPTGDVVATRPLMSLRTLAGVHDPARHYKTALGVQMTSAVRQVSADAVHNGPRVSELLVRLAADQPLRILPEVAAGAVLVDGQPSPMLAYAVRRAVVAGPGDVWMPVAALSRPELLQQVVDTGYGGHPVAFWRDLVEVLVPPVLSLLARGVGLEAHGQNLLVRLAYGRPAEAGYRDVGGVRLHAGRLLAAGVDLPVLRGSLPTDDLAELRAKPFATLFATVLSELAGLLQARHGADPQVLWRMVAELAELAPDAGDQAALFGASLPVKATTAMRLATDPVADIWTPVPNPITQSNPLAGVR